VISFARKIGEYAFLSTVDLKLLALTYMFESEVHGTAHIKTEPQSRRAVPPTENNTTVSGEVSSVDSKPLEQPEPTNEKKVNDDANIPVENGENDVDGDVDGDEDDEEDEKDQDKQLEQPESSDQNTNGNSNGVVKADDDGEGEWITVDNLAAMKLKHGNETYSNEPVSVGCITADFSMQVHTKH
jgi:hypothetical protein